MGGDHASPRKTNTDLMGQARAEVKSLLSFFSISGINAPKPQARARMKPRPYCAYWPPSTMRVEPVMKLEASLAR